MKVYAVLANAAKVYHDNAEKYDEFHAPDVDRAEKEILPSGSGFDSGTTFDVAASSAEKLVFNTSYHHMNDGGYYDGWSDHVVTVKASLLFGIDIRVSGRNRNDIKDYIIEVMHNALTSDFQK